ncbi:ATP-dependent DNA helicase PIF1-like [Aphis craccivora]|uniref:ATP-dependent DNA helicase n=1 Tax=Aphis craccivora TaxID=307492 RepID=A0A6G0VYV1_APHCR|nr:ATP-dependent DNA helicase PIF1-like [Aphis craccivora]
MLLPSLTFGERWGPDILQSLRSVDGVLCATFRKACQRLYLLENDSHWELTLADATVSAPENQSRTNDEIRNEVLVLIEDMCGSLLSTLGMSEPNRSTHVERVRKNVPLLNAEQKNVYDPLMKVVDDGTGGIYFLNALGGTGRTGKTFVISLILATIRSRSQIALAVASSGIAVTLLEGGRTVHSALKLPMNLLTVDNPTCTTTKNSATAKLMRECKIVIWDECMMAHKLALKAVYRTMKYLRGDSRRFGGAMILLSSDFRQTLPAAEFSRQLLALGNGQIPIDVLTGLISFPANFCEFTSSKEELITKVFSSIDVNYNNLDWISEQNNLQLKEGSIVIMLRNLNPSNFCNGTRLSVKKLMNNVIQSTIIKGNFKGEEVLIP